MRLAIMGAGSLGMILGAYIQKNGQDIDLIDVNEDHVNALNEKGASVIGRAKFNVPVTALTPGDMKGEYDLIIYLVKQTHNESALKSVSDHIAKDGIVATLQNGYPEPEVAKVVGSDRVVGVTIPWGGTWTRPGVSELTTDPKRSTFDIGLYKSVKTENLDRVKKVLELMGPVYILDDWIGARWGKLNINSAFSGMSAVLGCNYGEILDNDNSLRVSAHIGDELIRVAEASGITISPFQEFEQHENFKITDSNTMDQIFIKYREMLKDHHKIVASMLQDLEKGYKTEVNAINGVVCEYGRKHNIPTPMNDKVVEIIQAMEEGKYKPGFSNLDLFN